jgi:type IV pilus assembly protein PilV
MQLNYLSSKNRSRGFTLLEVLVAMVVLSIGLLGLSGLQTSSLRNNHSAFLRSQATVATNSIIDRMRANRDSAAAGDYDIVYTATPTASTCSSGCSTADVAEKDLTLWRAYIGRLPGGQGQIQVSTVTISGVAYETAEIKVRWLDARDQAGTQLELITRAQI